MKTYDPVEVELEVPAGLEVFSSRGPAAGRVDAGAGKAGSDGNAQLKRKRGAMEGEAHTALSASGVLQGGTTQASVFGKSSQAMKGHSAFLTFAMKPNLAAASGEADQGGGGAGGAGAAGAGGAAGAACTSER